MPLSILILTFNSSSYILELLNSIYKVLSSEIQKNEVEVIIFDNASKDNTLEILSQFGRGIKIHKSSENLGYARGINRAAGFASKELLVVINPDARLINFDKKMLDLSFNSDKNLAIAGLKIQDFDGNSEKNAGNFFNPFTFLLYSVGLESFSGVRFAPIKKRKVDYVSGGFVVFQKKHFEKLNGYDEDYFMYVEDMDICYRARELGLNVMYLPAGTISHKGQGSSNREFAIVNIYKGLTIFYKKNKSPIEEIYIRNLLSIKAAAIIFFGSLFGKKNLASTYLKALKAIS